jgi:hypothetical protein
VFLQEHFTLRLIGRSHRRRGGGVLPSALTHSVPPGTLWFVSNERERRIVSTIKVPAGTFGPVLHTIHTLAQQMFIAFEI